MDDYARVAEQTPRVDKAVATLRWTGSWYTVFLTVEPQGAGNLPPALKSAVKTNVERFHLAGQDLEITALFCDIRGFSRISRNQGPTFTLDWINDVLSTLSACVWKHQGVLVDYIGPHPE